jgi:hypothetical protein
MNQSSGSSSTAFSSTRNRRRSRCSLRSAVRQDGQKVLLAREEHGWGERGLLAGAPRRSRQTRLEEAGTHHRRGAQGLEKALAALWSDMPVQRCMVHKHRNLLAHAPDRLHGEVSADYNDMIYADSKPQVEAKRNAFIRRWRLKCRAVADSLEEAGDKLSPSRAFRKASGNRSAHRMQLNVYTKRSSGASRPRPCCPQRKPRRFCSGLCWLLVRSQCARWTVGKASTKGHPIRPSTSPHDRVTSSCWRSRQNQFQHKLRRQRRSSPGPNRLRGHLGA